MRSADRLRRGRPRLEALEPRSLLATMAGPGSLDPSFGGGTGSASISLGAPALSTTAGIFYSADSVVEAPGGKVVVSGTVSVQGPTIALSSELVVARFNADGSVDTTFGTQGRVALPIPTGSAFTAAVQPDGSIIEATAAIGGPGLVGYLAVRLGPTGSLDTTFGTGGVAQYPASATTPANSRISVVSSVLIQSNGQVVLAGQASSGFAAVRLNSDGSLDTAYGTGGTVVVPVMANGMLGDNADGAVLQADGEVVIVGTAFTGTIHAAIGMGFTSASAVALVRLGTTGTPDPGFGTSGAVLLPPNPGDVTSLGGNADVAVALDPTDQKIVVAATTYNAVNGGLDANKVYRLNTDGSLDTTFGVVGISRVDSGGFAPVVLANAEELQGSIAVDPSGRIVVPEDFAVAGSPLPIPGIYVLRLNADGSTDKTFADPTSSPYQPGLKNLDGSLLLTAQADGNVLLAGSGTTPSPTGRQAAFSVARLLDSASTGTVLAPTPTAPASFDGSGLTNYAVYLTGYPAGAVYGSFAYRQTPQLYLSSASADQIVPFGAAGVGQTIPAAADYLGLGKDQLAAYIPSTGTYAIGSSPGLPHGLSLQFGTPGAGQTIPVPADYQGTGKADIAVYLPAYGVFAILPSNGTSAYFAPFGTPGLGQSIPAPADYYGTHQADVAVYLAAFGAFAVQDPTGQTAGEIVPFGIPGVGQTIPVPGDYDGAGHAELAVYIPSLGAFFYRSPVSGKDVVVPIGTANSGQIPAPGDYDGSGRTEVAIFDPAKGFFEYIPSGGGAPVITYFGAANGGSVPVATPAGDLPLFTGEGSAGMTGHAIRPGFVPSSTPARAVGAATTGALAVPEGPRMGSRRVALARVNQGEGAGSDSAA